MASTNQTVHYNLSQYTANDKPTYLVDYNGDMAKIDAGIYSAESKATINEGAIGDLTDLNTTAKNDLVSAINEVEGEVGDNTTAISNLNTSVGANTGNIGTMANLDTTDKSNLVNAINEVEGNIEQFNLTHFDTVTTSDLTIDNVTIIDCSLTVASNDDGTIFKLYGQLVGQSTQVGTTTISFQSRIRPSSNLTINGAGMKFYEFSGGLQAQRQATFSINTNGIITISWGTYGSDPASEIVRLIYMANLYFAKDFGDTPVNN